MNVQIKPPIIAKIIKRLSSINSKTEGGIISNQIKNVKTVAKRVIPSSKNIIIDWEDFEWGPNLT